MDTFAALALATDPPSGSLLDRKPEPKHHALITLTMWKMIIGQSFFQLIVTFLLYFGGPHVFKYPPLQQSSLVFNVFVWMQIFNAINSRKIDRSFNIFEGFWNNWLFMGIMLIMIGGQTIIIFVGGAAFQITKLNGEQWGISLALGVLSIPLGVLIRCIPDSFIRTCINKVVPEVLRNRTPALNLEDGDHGLGATLLDIRDDLAFLKRVRGGRINALKQTIKHPKEMIARSRSNSRLSNSPMHSALAIPGLLAGTIAGLSPTERPSFQRENSGLSPADAERPRPTTPREDV
jgi:P-type Ca2+ transporter type 2C